VVVDPGNGTGGLLWEWLEDATLLRAVHMNFEPDGRFPAHHPDPSRLENLLPLRERVLAEGADLGFAYDGDADRTVAVLADGHAMDGSEMIAALVEALFGTGGPSRCAVSLSCSRRVLDFLRLRGIEPVMVPVGHAKVKRIMRSDPSIDFAGEQSGHYFYREFSCCESSLLTTLHLLRLKAEGKLERLVSGLPGPWEAREARPAFHFDRHDHALAACRRAAALALERFADPLEIMCEEDHRIRRRCGAEDVSRATGVRVDYADWWFCVRPSGTEPLARLTVEARSLEEADHLIEELSGPLVEAAGKGAG